MAGQYPLEALLRPAVELYTTTVCFIVAPWTFALTPLFGIVAALCFAWLGIVRLKQAGVVLRYRRNIRRLPKYTMTSAEMPVSNEHLFIGKGFRWTQKHTQRLADTYLPQFASYVEPSPLYQRARRLEKQLEFAPFPLKLVAKATAWDCNWASASATPWCLAPRGWVRRDSRNCSSPRIFAAPTTGADASE